MFMTGTLEQKSITNGKQQTQYQPLSSSDNYPCYLMKHKKVLIITYYWPPSGGSGVQRWLKFTKYLPESGWEPVIFTPENPDFELKDHSLEKEIDPLTEVIKFPIWEPYNLFRRFKKDAPKDTSKILEHKKPSLIDKLGIWLRANVLVPDPRIFWKKPAVTFLQDLISQGQFDAIITTGPPHSLHLIGLALKRATGIPWLADFRDPWSQWEFLDTLPMLSMIRKQHQKLEKQVLNEADLVMTISPTFQQDLQALSARPVHVLTNGYDEQDLPVGFHQPVPKHDHLEILYTGVIDAIRNPLPFLQALKECFGTSTTKVKLRFVGKVSKAVTQAIEEDTWLKAHICLDGYVPHQEVFKFYQQADLLLLILTDTKNAKGNIPGKLFEYMSTGRPILALGDPQGDAAYILNRAKAGNVFAHQDLNGLTSFLGAFERPSSHVPNATILSYSRRNLTRQLAHLLNESTNTIS
jgi:glycosyltransferase involved in cell wall biosynthesis